MNIRNAEDLRVAIADLEQKRISKEMDIVYNLNAYAQQMKDTLVNISMGVGTGLVAKKLITGKPDTFLGRIAGDVVQGVVTKSVFGNADTIKAVGTAIWKNIFKK
ncbi:MAG: hypothetical protein V4556_13095 [Bacteroidota bacterium]